MDPEQYRLSAGRHYRQLDRDAVPGQPSHGSLRVTMLAAPPTSPRTDPGAADPRRDERSPRRPDGGSQPLHDLLAAAAARRVMLVGRPGSGKTTALYQRAIALADDASAALPVVVALRELTGDYDDLERLILDCIGRCGVTPGPSLARLLAGQRFELLLDGLNERPAAVPATVFERLAHNYPDTAMIFSAREPMGALGATIYELRPLATTERNALVDAWLPGRAAELRTRLDRDAALDDLSRTPLLLTLLCETTRDGLPADSTRARLIAAFVANHARRYVERLGDPPHPRGRIDACLAGLATTMLAGPTPLQIADEPAAAALHSVLTRQGAASADPHQLLRHLLAHHLLARSAPDHLEFVHPLFQEFYAARHLAGEFARVPSPDPWIRDVFNRTVWTEPLCLLAEECDDEARARRLVDTAARVARPLAARLVRSLPSHLQDLLYPRLPRPDDTPGTRITLAAHARCDAVVDDLRRLGEHPDPEVRFQIADVLESIRGPRAAELNAALLADPDVSVVSAAAFNLSRHPTDVATLARALAREDLWAIEHPRALPLLMAAVMRSPDLDAGDLARRLVRRYLAASDQPSPKLHRSPRDLYFSGLFDASPAPAVSRALLALLPEIDEAHDDALLRVVFHTREPLEIRDELAPLPLARAAPIVARMLGAPDRFRVPDDLLLRLLDEDSAHRHHPDHARILAAAVERRCPALVPWLRRQLAQPHALHGTPSPLDALLELAPHAAHDDLRDLLVGGAPPHRREVAHLLVGCDHPALADLRDPAYALLCGDADEAVALVEYADPQRCAGHLDAVLTRSPPDIRRRVVRRFWERTDVAPFLRTLRGEPPPDLSVRDPRVPEPLRVLLVRSLLTDTDPTVTDVFLHHRDALREPLVHAYVLDRIERGEAPISCHDLWLLHAREPAWSPDLATIVRLVRDGHVDHGLTRHIAPDDLFTALRSLLGAPDRALRLRALCMLRVPDLHRAAFIDLLANPEFRRHVTHRLCQAGVVAAFPAILGYFDILDSDSREPPARDPDHPPGFLDGPLYWHEFEPHLKTAPAEHLRACLPLLARHIDTPPRVHAFLDVFARAPDFAYHSTLLVAARVKGVFRQEDLFDAWVRSAQTFEQRSTLLRLLDDPDLPVLLLARALAEHPYPETAAFAVERLQHAVDRPWDPVIRPDSSELHWLAQVLARLATPEQTHRLDRLAARAGDVLLSRLLHRILADIHERTGIYALHHTRMPRHGFTLLHLSDLHFHTVDQAERWHSALAEDLRRELRVDALDALVLSGDIVDRGRAAGYPIAAAFIERLCREFRLPRERVVVVPGNHDVDRAAAEPAIRPLPRARRRMPGPDEFEVGGKRYAIHDREGYRGRLAAFARFFADTLARPYPLDEAEQALLWVWPEPAIVVLGLSSVGELDGLRPDHATIDDRALSRALDRLRGEAELPDDALKIAVFHHPIHSAGDDRLRSSAFLDRLAQAGFSLVLHGHVHRADGMLFRYDRTLSGRRLEIVGAGTFGSRQHELVPGIPWQYNLLRFTGDSVQVATRRRESEQGPWRPDARWTSGPGSAAQAHYDLDLRAADPTVTR